MGVSRHSDPKRLVCLGKQACAKKRHMERPSDEERGALLAMLAAGKASAQKLTHARILLQAERRNKHREWEDARIAAALDVAVSTIAKVRRRLVAERQEVASVLLPPRREDARKPETARRGPI